MKRLLSLLIVLLITMLFGLDSRVDIECNEEAGIVCSNTDCTIASAQTLDMPMENPITYTNSASVVLSSTYCRTLGKHRFNSPVPVISELEPTKGILHSSIENCKDSKLILFLYAVDYYVFQQRRIII